MHTIIPIPEVKYIKRIGTLTKYEGEDAKKLSDLVKVRPEILDCDIVKPSLRLAMLAKLGILPASQEIFENITPVEGFEPLIRLLTANLATLADGEVNYHAFGSDNGTILPLGESNSQLGAEVVRKAVTSKAMDLPNKKALYTVFYDLAEAIGTHAEMGLFIKGTATPNSGAMWDRTLYAVIKSGSQTFTLDYEDTFVNA